MQALKSYLVGWVLTCVSKSQASWDPRKVWEPLWDLCDSLSELWGQGERHLLLNWQVGISVLLLAGKSCRLHLASHLPPCLRLPSQSP